MPADDRERSPRGREHDLAALNEALGRGSVVMVGPPGLGKSHLLHLWRARTDREHHFIDFEVSAEGPGGWEAEAFVVADHVERAAPAAAARLAQHPGPVLVVGRVPLLRADANVFALPRLDAAAVAVLGAAPDRWVLGLRERVGGSGLPGALVAPEDFEARVIDAARAAHPQGLETLRALACFRGGFDMRLLHELGCQVELSVVEALFGRCLVEIGRATASGRRMSVLPAIATAVLRSAPAEPASDSWARSFATWLTDKSAAERAEDSLDKALGAADRESLNVTRAWQILRTTDPSAAAALLGVAMEAIVPRVPTSALAIPDVGGPPSRQAVQLLGAHVVHGASVAPPADWLDGVDEVPAGRQAYLHALAAITSETHAVAVDHFRTAHGMLMSVVGHADLARLNHLVGLAALAVGEFEHAKVCLHTALDLARMLDAPELLATVTLHLAWGGLASDEDSLVEARLDAVDAHEAATGPSRRTPWVQVARAQVALSSDEVAATKHLAAAREEATFEDPTLDAAMALVEAAVAGDDAGAADARARLTGTWLRSWTVAPKGRGRGRGRPRLQVAEDGAWFWLEPAPAPTSLGRRAAARHILVALAEAASGPSPAVLDKSTLVARAWADDRASSEHLVRRLYATLHDLRRLGLGDLLEGRDGGYALSDRVRVSLSPTTWSKA